MTGLAVAASPAAPAGPGSLQAQDSRAGAGSPESRERRIEGHVRARAADGGHRLPWAMIEVDGVGRVLTDSVGAWSVSGVPPGLVRVIARSVGFVPAEVEVLVPRSGVVTVDLELDLEVLELPGILVQHEAPRIADPSERTITAEVARALVRLRGLEASPGMTEAGLGSVPQGGEQPGEPGGRGEALYLRGSASDLKLVLLDGAPIYTPFHLGGLLPSFDAAVLGSARHHVGGAPARYDGGLSYILDMRTRSPLRDRVHTRGWADLMSAGGSMDVPLGDRGGALLSARALHGLAGSLVGGGGGSPYGYSDGLARVEADVGESGSVFVTGFLNRESVFLDLAGSEHPPGSTLGEEDASWGNAALSVGWSGAVGDTRLAAGASTTTYRAELPMYGAIDVEATTPFRTILATGRTGRTRVTFDALRTGARGPTRFGVVFDRTDLRYGSLGNTVPDGARGFTGHGYVVGGYAEGTRGLAPGLDLRWGGRLDRFDIGAGPHADSEASFRGALRAALLWDLADDALVTVAVGRYHQLARRADLDATLGSGEPLETGNDAVTDNGFRRGPVLSVARGDHVVASLQQRLGAAVQLDTELFYKAFRDLAGIGSGSLTSSGVDVRVLRNGERVTAWLGYSLAWFWDPTGREGSDDFSGRHLLDVGIRSALVGPAHVDLRLSFSDGLPLTSVPVTADRAETAVPTFDNTPRTSNSLARTDSADGFLRIDAEVFAEWEGSVGPISGRVRPYFKVLNALARRDALFYYFEPWRSDELRPLAELSLLPVAGIEWTF